MSTRSLTIVMPGLLGSALIRTTPGALEGLDLNVLETIVSRAGREKIAADGMTETLFTLFNYQNSDADLPVAPLTLAFDGGEAGNHYWLRADPVHVRADRDRLVLFGNQGLTVSRAEVDELVGAFNELFAGDGYHLEAPAALRWYLRLPDAPALRTTPLERAAGGDVDPNLPRGSDALAWHAILNEVQMLFYNNPVNERRRREGLPEINSVWFWGGGAMPQPFNAPWDQVWSNDALTGSLASFIGRSAKTAPPTFEDWLEQADAAGNHLLVLEGNAAAQQFEDIGEWREQISVVTDEWLTPMSQALADRSLHQVRLLDCAGHSFSFTRKTLRRWWKRRRKLEKF